MENIHSSKQTVVSSIRDGAYLYFLHNYTHSLNISNHLRQEHFLKEIETIRRRVLALEDEAQRGTTAVVPAVTRSQVKSIAEEEASAKAEEVNEDVRTIAATGGRTSC